MKNFIKIAAVMPVLLALLLAGCALDDPSEPTDAVNGPGVDDAGARYVAIGNSLTAGFMDGGLMQVGQASSFPRLIANQLGLDNTAFSQPWIAAPGIGTSDGSDASMVAGVLRYGGSAVGLTLLGETPAADVQSTLLLAATQPTAYHNLGVPGAWLTDGLNAFNAASSMSVVIDPTSPNLFFEFINRSSFFDNTTLMATLPDGSGGAIQVPYESGSMVYKAIAKGGALVTLWLGNNDVLGPATGGDPDVGFGPAAAAAFQAEYTSTLSILAGGLLQRNGFPATIVVANIPSITSIPYFIPLEDFNTATGGFWADSFAETDVQFVLLPALSWIVGLDPSTVNIPSVLTLTSVEETDIATAVATFNGVIAGVSAAVNASGMAKIGLMDANAALEGLNPLQSAHLLSLLGTGMDLETAQAATYFSLDGIHPNSVGYGFVANEFIDVINDLDGTDIPPVDLDSLSWDPTYGVPVVDVEPTATEIRITPEAAAAMGAIFR